MLRGFKFSIYIIMYVVLIALTGILNVVIFKDLNWSVLLSVSFWVPIIINNTFYFAAFVITILLIFDVLELKDKVFVEIETDIMGERNKLVTDDFKQHIVNRNYFEKKNVWIQFVNVWLTNLQTKLKHKTVVEMKTTPQEQWSKKSIDYQKKVGTLNTYKTDEWMNENLPFRKKLGWGVLGNIKKLNYPEITVNEIIYGNVKYKQKRSELERHLIWTQITQKSIFIVLSIMMTVITNVLQVEKLVSTIDIIISLAIMLFTILLNVGAGAMAGIRAHKSRVSNASTRLGFVVDFLNGKTYKPAPMVDLEIFEQPKIEEIKIVEIETVNEEKEPL